MENGSIKNSTKSSPGMLTFPNQATWIWPFLKPGLLMFNLKFASTVFHSVSINTSQQKWAVLKWHWFEDVSPDLNGRSFSMNFELRSKNTFRAKSNIRGKFALRWLEIPNYDDGFSALPL